MTKKILACVLVLALLFGLTGHASEDVPTGPLRIKRWDEKTLREKYPTVMVKGAEYFATAGKMLGEDSIGEKLTSVMVVGNDVYTSRSYSIKCDVYAIKTVSSKYVAAVKFEGFKGYYPYSNMWYTPETLGDFIDDLNLKENLIINNKFYYEYWDGGAPGKGNYIMTEYSLPDPSVIWELLLSDRTAKNMGPEYYGGKTLMGNSVSVKITGEKNITLSVNEAGYLYTNILGTGKAFYIGKKKANDFARYVKRNGIEKILKPGAATPMPLKS